MGSRGTPTIAIGAGLLLLAVAPAVRAQARVRVVTATPSARYRAGEVERTLFGSGWRDLWGTPVTIPVFDPATYAGGLKFDKRGGGNQTITVHLTEEHGWHKYLFRSVDKFLSQAMPPSLQGTVLGSVLEEEVSALLPAAPLLVPPLLDAIGVLHVTPKLYVMADSPRLGSIRDTVSGMLGTVELKPSEAPGNQPGFAGSRSIKGTEAFLEDIESSRTHQVDEREFLAVRLIDFLINDADRAPDNVDWARFGNEGAYLWRPLPRDRDWAFMDASGLWNKLVVRHVYPKLIPFTETFPLYGLTDKTDFLDRRLLQRLTAADFREVSLRVQRAITDSVIATAVARLPREWRARTSAADRITRVLRARRDALPGVAMAFYDVLASEVDIHGTHDADRIIVERHDDGRVSVVITDPERLLVASERRAVGGRIVTTSAGAIDEEPYYARTFLPGETKEVRIYADSGNDVAVVGGAFSGSIIVRVIGGNGDDILTDSTGSGKTFLYDAEGSNQFEVGSRTHVDQRAWEAPKQSFGFRLGDPWKPDWGKESGWHPVLDYNTGAGIILGAGRTYREYGFRRLPYHWEAKANLMVGTSNGRLGAEGQFIHRAENSSRSFRVEARASRLETTRFFGYGNTTAEADRSESLVDQMIVGVEPSIAWDIGWRSREDEDPLKEANGERAGLRPLIGELRVGADLSWYHPEPGPTSLVAIRDVRGANDFGIAGATLGLELDRTDDDALPTMGWTLDANAAAYPLQSGSGHPFGTASARGSFYVPLGRVGGPHLAFRAGGDLATGGYPVQFAAALGGKRSLRGYSFRRFAGDASVYGGTELRVPVGTVNFIVRSQLGVFGLADAGRVWFDGNSDGGLRPAFGGGFWLAAFGKSVSVAYARGDGNRFYLTTGM